MYIRLPEAIGPIGDIFSSGGQSFQLFLADPNSLNWVEFEPGTKRFREKRRKNFSDVYHVKLVEPPDFDYYPVYEPGSIALVPSIYTETSPVPGKNCYISAGATSGTEAYIIYVGFDTLISSWKAECTIKFYTFSSRSGRYLKYRQAIDTGTTARAIIEWKKNSSGNYYVYKRTATTVNGDITAIVEALGVPGRSASSIVQDIYRTCAPLAKTFLKRLASLRSSQVPYHTSHFIKREPVTGDLFREYDFLFTGVPDFLYGPGYSQYFREVGIQQSYLAAVSNVPRMSENNISNILEIASFIRELVINHRISMPRSLSDAWLAYRYQYKTSESDFKEAIRFVHRRMDLPKSADLKCYGSYSLVYKNTPCLFRCSLRSAPKELAQLERIWTSLYEYGLSPSFYAIWDMIPYSFIVDWFIPIGNIASVYDAERYYIDNRIISDVNFSITYDVKGSLGMEHHYTRWYSSTPPSLKGYYFLESNPSGRTIGMRILDTLSLTIR